MGRPLGSRYVMEESLGRGAMGEVFASRDTEGNELAVKVLHADLARDQTVVSRFVQERGILLSIQSPHLVRVHDLVAEGETLAIVMERVHGPDLKRYLDQHGTLAPAEICRLGAGIASGLAAVHAAGAVHRDIKPENVLLDTTGPSPVPKVTDFGIASLADSERARSTMLVGTPEYIAPELANGSDPSPAADLYSLGILLYRLACGVTPFVGGSLIAVLKRAAEVPPGRPPGIPDELWDLIAWLLEKDPARRPDAAQRVAFQLQALAATFDGVPAAPLLTAPPETGTVGAGGSPTDTAPFLSRTRPTAAIPTVPGEAPESSAAPTPAPGRRRLSLALAAAALAALLVVGALAFLLLRPPSTEATAGPPSTPTPSASTSSPKATPTPTSTPTSASATPTAAPGTVPNIVGLLLPEAQKALGAATRMQVTDKYDPSKPDGAVLTQQPAAGTDLASLGTMRVTVARSAVANYLADQEPVSGYWGSEGTESISGVAYPHALSTSVCGFSSSGSAVEYNLGRNYQTFAATAGIADDSDNSGSTALLEVFADGRQLYSGTIAYGQPFPISVDVTDVLRLKIQWQPSVCAKGSSSSQATLVLGDPRILGIPGKVPQPTSTR